MKSNEEYKKDLTPEEYHVLRKGGTGRAFSGSLYDNKKEGLYQCKACGNKIFSSKDKFDSGSGWPSFHSLIGNDSVILKEEGDRTEVKCFKCDSHLGHVFTGVLITIPFSVVTIILSLSFTD